MIIELPAKSLLMLITNLSAISKNGSKSILVKVSDVIELFASNSSLYGQGIVQGKIHEQGNILIPITLIPVLDNLGDKIITLSVDANEINIQTGRNKISLPQIGGSINDVSIRDYVPKWMDVDISRIKDIKYASGISAYGLDIIWATGNRLLASDKVRISCYRPKEFMIDDTIAIPNIAAISGDDVKMAIHDHIWVGNDGYNISMSRVAMDLPYVLSDVTNIELPDLFVVNKDEFGRNVSLTNRLSDNLYYVTTITSIKDEIKISTESTKTKATELYQNVLVPGAEGFSMKLNSAFLHSAVDNCRGKQIGIGKLNIDKFNMFVIHDVDVTHYMLEVV